MFLRLRFKITQRCFIQWLGAGRVTRHNLTQWRPGLLAHIYFTCLDELKVVVAYLSSFKCFRQCRCKINCPYITCFPNLINTWYLLSKITHISKDLYGSVAYKALTFVILLFHVWPLLILIFVIQWIASPKITSNADNQRKIYRTLIKKVFIQVQLQKFTLPNLWIY